MSSDDEYQAFLGGSSEPELPLIVDVPPAPPTLHGRHRAALSQSRFAVGVDVDPYEGDSKGSGAVWQSWFLLGLSIAVCVPAGIGLLLSGEWVMVLIAAPLAGLFVVGMVRLLRTEQKAQRKKRARQANRRSGY